MAKCEIEVSLKPLEELFRARVITFLVDKDLLPPERANMLRGWVHSGFNVHRNRRGFPIGISERDRQPFQHPQGYRRAPPVLSCRSHFPQPAEYNPRSYLRLHAAGIEDSIDQLAHDPLDPGTQLLDHTPYISEIWTTSPVSNDRLTAITTSCVFTASAYVDFSADSSFFLTASMNALSKS